MSEQQVKCCQSPILAIKMKISKMANIVYRQMPAPRELPQQIPAPQAIKAIAWMQKPQGGSKRLVKSQGVRGGMVMDEIDTCISLTHILLAVSS